MQILSNEQFEKLFIDYFEKYYLPLCFPNFNERAYDYIHKIEKTFYYPIDEHKNEFLIWMNNDIGWMEFDVISKKDETKSNAIWFMTQLMNNNEPRAIFLLIKKNNQLKDRLKYMNDLFKPFTLPITSGPNKNFIKENNQRIKDPIESRLRHEVFKRDGFKCVECGKTNKETTLHVDHITPISQKGTDELDNLQTLCQACNLVKSNKKYMSSISLQKTEKNEKNE